MEILTLGGNLIGGGVSVNLLGEGKCLHSVEMLFESGHHVESKEYVDSS